MESFGDRVRRLRKAKGWTQEKLVEESDISIRYIRKIERNTIASQSLTLGVIEKLAKALNEHPAWLLYPEMRSSDFL